MSARKSGPTSPFSNYSTESQLSVVCPECSACAGCSCGVRHSYSLSSFRLLSRCLQLAGLWEPTSRCCLVRQGYRWFAPLVLATYILLDLLFGYHGPTDDNVPTDPNHFAILSRLLLFLTSHVTASLYLHTGHLDLLVRSTPLTESEFQALDKRVSQYLLTGVTFVSVVLGFMMVVDFRIHQQYSIFRMTLAWLKISIRLLYGYFSIVFVCSACHLLCQLLLHDIKTTTARLAALPAVDEAARAEEAEEQSRLGWSKETRPFAQMPGGPVAISPAANRQLQTAIMMHKGLRQRLQAASEPLQWWFASFMALSCVWLFTLWFVAHELPLSTEKKLMNYLPLWMLNMFFTLLPILSAAAVHQQSHQLVDTLNDLIINEGLFAERQVLHLFVDYASRTRSGFHIFHFVVTRNPTYFAFVFGVCEFLVM